MLPLAPPFASSDRQLAMRVEAAESANILAMARAAAATMPNAAFEEVAGGTAVFAGLGSPMTHAMGIGLSGDTSEAQLERMERFFRDRGSPCLIDLCPMADASVIAFVQSRPYRVIEFNNVLVRRIAADEVFAPVPDSIRLLAPAEYRRVSSVIMQGFMEGVAPSDEALEMMSGTSDVSQCWMVDTDRPLGGAMMGIQNKTALFYGDALLPEARRVGHQTALIRARLAAAQRQGCDLAMVNVLPGNGSHRNYERAGFQLIYMRVNVLREF